MNLLMLKETLCIHFIFINKTGLYTVYKIKIIENELNILYDNSKLT